jgi:hypothetical protein
MIDPANFANNFPNATVPNALKKLLDFQNNTSGPEFYATGFELIVNQAPGMLETYSSDVAFTNAFCIFAQANGSGSLYAIWRGIDTDLNTAPIILFGDEGGVAVIAQHIQELLQLLSVDAEAWIGSSGIYMKRQDGDRVSPMSETFKGWLKTNFNLDAISDTEPVVTAAQAKHQTVFEQWMKTHSDQ